MTLSRRARAAFGFTLFFAAVGLTLVANAQPVGVAVKPAGPPGKGKDKNGKDDRDWNEHITLPVEFDASKRARLAW